ncbi:MAG: hypothetical protein KAS48_03630 [Gammaproteobacteria bacterium]|nr:hypothetical protein [Gammaproteobacteria bacterium]
MSKISSFCVPNLGNRSMRCSTFCIHAVVRNSPLLPAWMQVRDVSRDAEALRAIRALHPKGIINLNILDHNLLRPE